MNDTEKIIFEKDLKLDIKDFNNKLSKAAMSNGLTIYRGDNREPHIILSEGFSPWYPLDINRMRHLAVYFVNNKDFRSLLWQWWKYPSARTINMRNNPFVATGISDSHLGNYKYKIQLEQFHMYEIQKGALLHKIGFEGDSLETSSIIAIQIDKEEIIFGTNIPPKYISDCKI